MSEPRERPIIFSGPLVRAILEGRKSVTRRVIPNPVITELGLRGWRDRWGNLNAPGRSPYRPGDRLWVRETWQMNEPPSGAIYRADDIAGHIDGGWRPSIFMPRWASRLTLEVLSVRAERLQDITEEDAEKEGAGTAQFWTEVPGRCAPLISRDCYLAGFANLWDQINGTRSPWERNNWVWRYEFKRLEAPHA